MLVPFAFLPGFMIVIATPGLIALQFEDRRTANLETL